MSNKKWTDYRGEIVGFVEEKLLYGERFPISYEDSLRDGGVVDSTGILEIMAFIESKFQIVVNDEDMVPENFKSIKGICEFVRRKVRGEES